MTKNLLKSSAVITTTVCFYLPSLPQGFLFPDVASYFDLFQNRLLLKKSLPRRMLQKEENLEAYQDNIGKITQKSCSLKKGLSIRKETQGIWKGHYPALITGSYLTVLVLINKQAKYFSGCLFLYGYLNLCNNNIQNRYSQKQTIVTLFKLYCYISTSKMLVLRRKKKKLNRSTELTSFAVPFGHETLRKEKNSRMWMKTTAAFTTEIYG